MVGFQTGPVEVVGWWNRTLNGLSEEQPNAHCNFLSIRRQGQAGKKKRKALIVGQW